MSLDFIMSLDFFLSFENITQSSLFHLQTPDAFVPHAHDTEFSSTGPERCMLVSFGAELSNTHFNIQEYS